jgi:hypothetical protein
MGRRKVFFWDGRNCINFFPMVSKPNTGLGFDYAIYQGRVSSTFPQIMVMFWDFPGEISILSRNEKMKGLILNPKSASIAPISSSTNNDILKEFEAELKNLEDNNIPHQIIHQISDLLLDIKKLQEEEIFINSNIKYHLDLKINLKIVMNKMKYFSQQNLVDVNEKELQDFNLVLTELNNIADKLQHRNSERFNYRKLLFALKKIIVSIMQCAVLLTIGIGMTGGTMGFSVGAIANSFGVVFSGGLFAPFAPAGFAACVVAGAIIGGFTGCMLGIALGLYTGYKELFDSQNTKNSIDNLVTSIKTSFITPAATFSSNLS